MEYAQSTRKEYRMNPEITDWVSETFIVIESKDERRGWRRDDVLKPWGLAGGKPDSNEAPRMICIWGQQQPEEEERNRSVTLLWNKLFYGFLYYSARHHHHLLILIHTTSSRPYHPHIRICRNRSRQAVEQIARVKMCNSLFHYQFIVFLSLSLFLPQPPHHPCPCRYIIPSLLSSRDGWNLL